eukprot:490060_1
MSDMSSDPPSRAKKRRSTHRVSSRSNSDPSDRNSTSSSDNMRSLSMRQNGDESIISYDNNTTADALSIMTTSDQRSSSNESDDQCKKKDNKKSDGAQSKKRKVPHHIARSYSKDENGNEFGIGYFSRMMPSHKRMHLLHHLLLLLHRHSIEKKRPLKPKILHHRIFHHLDQIQIQTRRPYRRRKKKRQARRLNNNLQHQHLTKILQQYPYTGTCIIHPAETKSKRRSKQEQHRSI